MFRRDLACIAAIAAMLAASCAAVSAIDQLDAQAKDLEEDLIRFQEVKEEIRDQILTEEVPMDQADEETILLEDERIEAALIAQGYYREDIPLTFLEQDYLHTASREFGIDYYVMVALIERETNFRNITGDKGNAYGYCQIWPKWWAGLMAEIGAEDLMEPYDNFRVAAAILSQHVERYGTIEKALTAYNTGKPGKSEYSRDVLANAEKWRNP